jgi:hypothetical protein
MVRPTVSLAGHAKRRATENVLSCLCNDPGGFHRIAAEPEAWANQNLYGLAASVGCAPHPDKFSPKGQDWGLPPIVPGRPARADTLLRRIQSRCCAPTRQARGSASVSTMSWDSRAFSGFFCRRAAVAADGAYVRYPFSESAGHFVALESHRIPLHSSSAKTSAHGGRTRCVRGVGATGCALLTDLLLLRAEFRR